MRITFSDGVTIETNGPLRKLLLADGWYVAGRGRYLPCRDEQDADNALRDLRRALERFCLWCYDNEGCPLTYKASGDSFVWEMDDDLDAEPTEFETREEAEAVAERLTALRRLGGWVAPVVRVKPVTRVEDGAPV